MADLLPDPPPPEGNRWPRGPVDYQEFLSVLENRLDRLEREGILVDSRLSFRETVHRGRLLDVNLLGWVRTASGGRLHVNELLSVLHRPGAGPAVATREYAYHGRAVLGQGAGQQLFRYDNCHGGLDTLHVHRFDVDGIEAAIEPVAPDQLPGLAGVIRQAEYLAAYLRQLKA